MAGILNFSASRAGQIAAVERLQHEDERVPFAAFEFLAARRSSRRSTSRRRVRAYITRLHECGRRYRRFTITMDGTTQAGAADVSGVPGEDREAFLRPHHKSSVLELGISRRARRALAAVSSLSRYLQNFRVAPQAWPEQEERILRIFKRKAHQFLDKPPAVEDDFHWLALMQHHGAPTRLIDFTWSPYVAAFFALERTLHDGVVWAMNPARIDSSRAPKPARMDPRAPGNFHRYFLGKHRFIWMGEPHTMNRRLIAQSGTFAVPGVLDVPIEEMLKDTDQENIMAKFVMTHPVREVGMRELYRMNITYATLFPDLDGLAKSMDRAGISLGIQSADDGAVSDVAQFSARFLSDGLALSQRGRRNAGVGTLGSVRFAIRPEVRGGRILYRF